MLSMEIQDAHWGGNSYREGESVNTHHEITQLSASDF